jgi:multiple sugar transport system permease protein
MPNPVSTRSTRPPWVWNMSWRIVPLTSCGRSPHPIGWLSSPNLALVAVILASIWIGIPFNMVLLYSGLEEVPQDLYEAARVDGANGYRTFRHVTLPSIRNVSAIVLMLGFVYTMRAFDQIYIMTQGGPANGSQVFATWSYILSFSENNFGQGAAVGDLLMIVSLLCTLLYMRAYGKEHFA